jgi:hypothetical protein
VLGDDINYYIQNRPVTPYLNWELAQGHFGNLGEFQAVFDITQNISNELPSYIIDKGSLMPELQYKLPDIFKRYEQTEDSLIYKLK